MQHCVCLCRVVCSLWLVCACLALCPRVTTSKWEYFSKKPRSVKTGFNSRVGFYQAVAFEATAERAGWVLSNSVSGKFYCIVSAVKRTNFFSHQIELKPWVEENFTIFASAVGNSPLNRFCCLLLVLLVFLTSCNSIPQHCASLLR